MSGEVDVTFVFGRRQKQDMPGYPIGPIDPFIFTVKADKKPESWHSAYALLAFHSDDFMKACLAAETSSWLNALIDRDVWIPTCYLDKPTIEVGDEELLLDGAPANRWLSRAKH